MAVSALYPIAEKVSETQVFNNLQTAVLVLDDEHHIRLVNTAAERLLQQSRQTLLGKQFSDCVAGSEPITQLMQQAQQQQQSFSLRTWELNLRPGQTIIVDCHALPLDDESSTGVVLELHDVTRREKIQRETDLARQHGVSRTLVRQLAHEIKNPLGGIRGSAQLLSRKLQREENKRFINVIISEVDRLADLVDSLLGPGQPLELRPHNIHQMIDRALELISAEADQGLELVRDFDPSLPLVNIDPDQMLQVLLNLLNNAAQALDNRGQIIVRTRVVWAYRGNGNKGFVAISIHDNGPGVPKELGDRIFFPLVSGRPQGTGIGLAVVQEIMERHGGQVEFRSETGETVFTLSLPIEAGE